MFELWSKNKPQARQLLRPNLGMRSWDEISESDKIVIWQHFVNNGWINAGGATYWAVHSFNEANKARAFCQHILNHGGPHYMDRNGMVYGMERCCQEFAQQDFQHIFHREAHDVVYELLSHYIQKLEKDSVDKENKVRFGNLFNDISKQFGLNVTMLENSFIPRQEEKIIEDVYKPVLNYLSDKKWEEVSNLFADAFVEYQKNTPQGYSNCVTNVVGAVQAFLQILVDSKTGKGEISKLITEAQKRGFIPNDFFTQKIFENIESILARERQETGIAHPKKEYATEKNARTILNLAMVFIQHCIQK